MRTQEDFHGGLLAGSLRIDNRLGVRPPLAILQHLHRRRMHAPVAGGDDAAAGLRRAVLPGGDDAAGAGDDRDQRRRCRAA